MDAAHKQVFFPKTLQELFNIWNRYPGATLFGGGTDLIREQEKIHSLELPVTIVSLEKIQELRVFTRTERYIEIGSMIKLNEILRVEKILPHAFAQAIKSVASYEVRNIATLGGNLSSPHNRLDAAAPLIALDARYELRSAQAARWVSASRFASRFSEDPDPGDLKEALVRIRVPLESWNYSRYKKIETEQDYGGSIVFLARVQKDILTDIRFVFAGETAFRDKNIETALAGKRVPLERRDLSHFRELFSVSLLEEKTIAPMIRAKILDLMESYIRDLT